MRLISGLSGTHKAFRPPLRPIHAEPKPSDRYILPRSWHTAPVPFTYPCGAKRPLRGAFWWVDRPWAQPGRSTAVVDGTFAANVPARVDTLSLGT